MSEKDRNGQIGIVNGKVVVKNPLEDGAPAMLHPAGEGLQIFVNDNPLVLSLQVFEDDVIDIKPSIKMKEARCTIQVSRDAYSAEMAVSPRTITEHQLIDIPMSEELKLKAEKTTKEERTFTFEEAEAQLRERNVVFGVDHDAVKKVVEEASGVATVVATGLKPLEGENGRIEFLKATKMEKIDYDDNINTKVDFKERYRLPDVKKGDVVAKVHPPIEGVPGKTVAGKVVEPRPVSNAKMKLKEGIEFVEENGELIAQKDGRLSVTGDVISVSNIITHIGDVNMESGNIRFNGDIRILGNIMDDMLVDAKGDLNVQGNCYGADIKAGTGILVTQNIIKCDVHGGLRFTLLKELASHVTILENDYQLFLDALQQVFSSLSEKDQAVDKSYFRRIIKAIQQKMPPSLTESLTYIVFALEENDDEQLEYLKTTAELMYNLLSGKLDLNSMVIPEKIGGSLRSFLSDVETQLSDIPPFVASYVQNSTIRHSGEIQIVGAGSYYSSLYSGDKVTIQGVCRGGTIEAMGDVRVKEFAFLSTEAIPDTSQIRIKVPSKASIYLNLVHEDITVQVGKLVHRFDSDYSNIKISHDVETGMIKLSTF